MNMLKMKSADKIKYEACQDDISLAKVLEVYNLDFSDIGLFFIDKNICNYINNEKNDYPINIFYSLQKDEIHQLKVNFTHEKIKKAINSAKSRQYYKVS